MRPHAGVNLYAATAVTVQMLSLLLSHQLLVEYNQASGSDIAARRALFRYVRSLYVII